MLEIDRKADVKEIKRAYFLLSKEFHPDRFFRRELGTFGVRIERIFRNAIRCSTRPGAGRLPESAEWTLMKRYFRTRGVNRG